MLAAKVRCGRLAVDTKHGNLGIFNKTETQKKQKHLENL